MKPETKKEMEKKISKFTLRVDEDTLQKFRYVSEYNARSANRELEVLMKKHISEFESKHGKI